MPQRRQRLARRRRPQLVADRRQGPDARREWVAIAVDDVVELAQQCGGLFVVQVNVHDPQMVALTLCAESAAPLVLRTLCG
jgi:hypothetical protein